MKDLVLVSEFEGESLRYTEADLAVKSVRAQTTPGTQTFGKRKGTRAHPVERIGQSVPTNCGVMAVDMELGHSVKEKEPERIWPAHQANRHLCPLIAASWQ